MAVLSMLHHVRVEQSTSETEPCTSRARSSLLDRKSGLTQVRGSLPPLPHPEAGSPDTPGAWLTAAEVAATMEFKRSARQRGYLQAAYQVYSSLQRGFVDTSKCLTPLQATSPASTFTAILSSAWSINVALLRSLIRRSSCQSYQP